MERRLTAILAADIVGYSQLMGTDEARTVRDLKAHQAVLLPMVSEFGGRIIDTAGDGILAEFASAVKAVECAVAIQKIMADRNAVVNQARRMQFRIGVNIGDVICDEARIYGDGINVAARLEGIADPGGVCVSEDTHRQTRGKVNAEFADIGEQSLKNIARPVCAYKLVLDGSSTMAAPKLQLPSKPSVAVLPFQNLSADPEQDYFADGIVEDIITALSRFRWLFVIARNSSFAYKGHALDVRQISQELGVRYLLEGSVRRTTDRIRVTAQLIDCTTGGHVWAERYDRNLGDIFDLQDDITRRVAAEIEPRLLTAEGKSSLARSAETLGAWEMVAQALTYFWRTTRADSEAAIKILTRAAAQFPDYAAAHSRLAFSLNFAMHMGWLDGLEALAKAGWHASHAATIDENDPWTHLALGYTAMMSRKTEESINSFRKALNLNPSSATSHGHFGRALAFAGRDEEAIAHLEEALRLSPYDPQNATFETTLAMVHYLAGRFQQAVDFNTRALKSRQGYQSAQRSLCASLAQVGRLSEARELLKRIREQQPKLSVSWIRQNVPYQTPELTERFLDGMRKAGLPVE